MVSDRCKLVVRPHAEPVLHPRPVRDPIGNGVFHATACTSVTRNRETIYGDYIFKYHPDFDGLADRYYDRDDHASTSRAATS